MHEIILERHVKAVYSGFVLYCHYYNNDKECPFGDVCIFEHEESEKCKYGKGCERQMCMYTHDEEDEIDDDFSDSDDGNSDEDVEKLKPVLEKVKMAVEKCDNLIDKCSLKCKNCDFEAKDKNGLVMHTKAKHTTKAK